MKIDQRNANVYHREFVTRVVLFNQTNNKKRFVTDLRSWESEALTHGRRRENNERDFTPKFRIS